MITNYERTLYHYGPWLIEHLYSEESFEDYGCDDIGGDTITIVEEEIRCYNPDTGKRHIYSPQEDWRILQRVYRMMTKKKVLHWKYANPQELTGSILYRWFRRCIPYTELTWRQQMNHDKFHNRYPAIDSKYIEKIPDDELEKLIEGLRLDHVQDLADNTSYNEGWRNESRYMRARANRIQALQTYLQEREPEIWVDPAGGTHYRGEIDHAAQYE